ncbi:hypothetical protein GEMRC1_003484 [Eukaryota sp. GEM-RC1]
MPSVPYLDILNYHGMMASCLSTAWKDMTTDYKEKISSVSSDKSELEQQLQLQGEKLNHLATENTLLRENKARLEQQVEDLRLYMSKMVTEAPPQPEVDTRDQYTICPFSSHEVGTGTSPMIHSDDHDLVLSDASSVITNLSTSCSPIAVSTPPITNQSLKRRAPVRSPTKRQRSVPPRSASSAEVDEFVRNSELWKIFCNN